MNTAAAFVVVDGMQLYLVQIEASDGSARVLHVYARSKCDASARSVRQFPAAKVVNVSPSMKLAR